MNFTGCWFHFGSYCVVSTRLALSAADRGKRKNVWQTRFSRPCRVFGNWHRLLNNLCSYAKKTLSTRFSTFSLHSIKDLGHPNKLSGLLGKKIKISDFFRFLAVALSADSSEVLSFAAESSHNSARCCLLSFFSSLQPQPALSGSRFCCPIDHQTQLVGRRRRDILSLSLFISLSLSKAWTKSTSNIAQILINCSLPTLHFIGASTSRALIPGHLLLIFPYSQSRDYYTLLFIGCCIASNNSSTTTTTIISTILTATVTYFILIHCNRNHRRRELFYNSTITIAHYFPQPIQYNIIILNLFQYKHKNHKNNNTKRISLHLPPQ